MIDHPEFGVTNRADSRASLPQALENSLGGWRVPMKYISGIVLLLIIARAEASEAIAVIGTGNVGGALGERWGRNGHTIIYGSRDPARPAVRELVARSGKLASATWPAEAVRQAQIILFAVPWIAAEASAKSLGDLKGKIVLDATNPLTFDARGLVELPVPHSGAELLQRWLPGAAVVKAFSTLEYRVMSDPSVAGGPVTVLLATDDAGARERVAALVRELGLEPFNAGPLKNSRYLEGMALLYVDLGSRPAAQSFEYYLRPLPTR